MTTRMMVNDRMKLQPKPPLSLKKNMKTDEESKKYAYEISFRKVLPIHKSTFDAIIGPRQKEERNTTNPFSGPPQRKHPSCDAESFTTKPPEPIFGSPSLRFC